MTGFYPCPWDDLIDEKSKAYATVYTLSNVRKDSLIGIRKAGIIFNKKDRIFVLAKIVGEKIGNLIEMEKLDVEGFLFISDRGKRYHMGSLQQIVKKAAKKAELGEYIVIH